MEVGVQAGRRAEHEAAGAISWCLGTALFQGGKSSQMPSEESPAIKQLNPVYAIICMALLGSWKRKEISTETQRRAQDSNGGGGRGEGGRGPAHQQDCYTHCSA